MGEDIRIFHIEIIHFIGCNITTVIVIIFTERTFKLRKKADMLFMPDALNLVVRMYCSSSLR